MKFFIFATLLVGVSLLLSAGGYADQLPVTGGLMKQLNLVNATGSPSIEEVKSSGLFASSGGLNALQTILTGVAVAGIVLGTIGRAPDLNFLLAGLVFVLTSAILADYIGIYSILRGFGVLWIQWVGTLFFGVLIVGFFITAIEFWRGTD